MRRIDFCRASVEHVEKVEAFNQRLAAGQTYHVDDAILVQPCTLTKTSSGKRRHRYFKKLYLDGGLKPFEFSKDGQVSA